MPDKDNLQNMSNQQQLFNTHYFFVNFQNVIQTTVWKSMILLSKGIKAHGGDNILYDRKIQW